MLSSMSSLARSAVGSLIVLASLQAAAAASPISHMNHLAIGNGLVEPVFDDGGWRSQRYSCCHGRRDGLRDGGGALSRSLGPRLGNLDRRYEDDNDTSERGSNNGYADEPVYQHQLLDRPRVYQRDSLGGGYFGDNYDDGLQ